MNPMNDDIAPAPQPLPSDERRLSPEAQKWYEENKEAVDSWNAYIAKYGLPLAEYRQF
jgi:post-segregation antitoxin (ccd killing protein)